MLSSKMSVFSPTPNTLSGMAKSLYLRGKEKEPGVTQLTTVLPLPIWATQEKNMQLLFSLAYFLKWNVSSKQWWPECIQKERVDSLTE